MATPLITAAIRNSLKLTLDETWGDEMKGAGAWEALPFKVTTTSDAWVDDQEYAGTGTAPRKREGAQMASDAVVEGYSKRYTMATSALRMVVSEETIMFKKYEKAVDGSGNIARSLKLTQEYDAANIFIRAFNSSYVGGDAVELCSTSHKLAKGGTYANMFTNGMSLNETAVEQMWVNLRKIPSSNGYITSGRRLKCLVVPTDLRFRAKRILKSEQQNDTNNNAINALKSEGIDVVENPYFTSTTNWWGGSDAPVGLRFIWAKKPMFREHNTEDNFTITYSGVQIYDLGWTDPRAVYGSNI